jgi:lysyl-tRNA synthetase class II
MEVSPLSRANDADPFLTDRFEFYRRARAEQRLFELNDRNQARALSCEVRAWKPA